MTKIKKNCAFGLDIDMQNESQKDNQYFKNSEGVFLMLSKFNIFIFLSSKKFSFSPIIYSLYIFQILNVCIRFFFHKYISTILWAQYYLETFCRLFKSNYCIFWRKKNAILLAEWTSWKFIGKTTKWESNEKFKNTNEKILKLFF